MPAPGDYRYSRCLLTSLQTSHRFCHWILLLPSKAPHKHSNTSRPQRRREWWGNFPYRRTQHQNLPYHWSKKQSVHASPFTEAVNCTDTICETGVGSRHVKTLTFDGGAGSVGICLYSSCASESIKESKLRVHRTLSLSEIAACKSPSNSIAPGCSVARPQAYSGNEQDSQRGG